MKWLHLIWAIPYYGLQASFWIYCTSVVISDVYNAIVGIEHEWPEWMALFYIGYFVWTNTIAKSLLLDDKQPDTGPDAKND